jgi:hypothetical protein
MEAEDMAVVAILAVVVTTEDTAATTAGTEVTMAVMADTEAMVVTATAVTDWDSALDMVWVTAWDTVGMDSGTEDTGDMGDMD